MEKASSWIIKIKQEGKFKMVRVDEIVTSYGNVQKVNLFADSKSEVTQIDMETGETDMEIVGFDPKIKITQGSMVITADGDAAFLKSDGTWRWQ